MTWPTVALGEVATVERRGIQPADISRDAWYVALEHIESGGRTIQRQCVVEADLKSTKFQFGPEHILYGKLRPHLAKIATPDFSGVCSTDILPVRPGALIDRSYLTHYLRQGEVVDLANSRATGANLPRLSPAELSKLPVPLPPLDEQRRIAAVLEQADVIRTKRRNVVRELRASKGNLVNHVMCGVATQNVPLGSLVFDHQVGLDRRGSDQGSDFSFEYLKMDSITRSGELDLSHLVSVDASEGELNKYSLADGDIVFNTRNSRDLVGNSTIYRGGPRLYYNIMRIRLYDPIGAPHLHSFLWSPAGRRQLESIKSGTTSFFAIYAKGLMKIRVPMPAPGDGVLEHIAIYLGVVDREIDRALAALEVDDALFASLQSRAFKGEL